VASKEAGNFNNVSGNNNSFFTNNLFHAPIDYNANIRKKMAPANRMNCESLVIGCTTNEF
jgi:hypothetical protein